MSNSKPTAAEERQAAQHQIDQIEDTNGDAETALKADAQRVDAEVAQYAEVDVIPIDEETNKRLKRKIDRRVLVVMMVTYFLQAIDKSTMSFSSIMGIQEDTHLHGQQYSWLTTCVYLAVLVVEYPTNWIIQRVPVAKYLNFSGLVVARTFLGALEAVCQPTFVILSGMWYKREEQAATVTLWYMMNGVQQIFGGLLAYCFSNIPLSAPIKSWQALFMTYGCITVLWGMFVLFWLPDSPMRAKCFTEEEKKLMVARVRSNQTGLQNKKFRVEQLFEAFTDFQTLAFAIIQVCTTLPSSGLGAFSSILVKSFGFNVLQTQLQAMVLGAIQIIVMLSAVWLDRKTKQTTLVMAGAVLPSIAGTIVLMTTVKRDTKSQRVGLLLAYYVIVSFWASSALALSLVTRNVAGQTKKAAVIAINFIFWAVGNAIGPQVFRATDAPRYLIAFSVQLACYCILVITLMLLRGYYILQIKEKEKKIANNVAIVDEAFSRSFEDRTDKENVNFKYVY